MPRFYVPLEIKSLEETGRFAGYASVFGVVDSQRDVVLRGAFKHTLSGRAKEIKLLWQHQWEEPIGMVVKLFEDDKGLYVEGLLLMAV
jgi:HK97 family phage prohead protease